MQRILILAVPLFLALALPGSSATASRAPSGLTCSTPKGELQCDNTFSPI
jgi:hypothetical protein